MSTTATILLILVPGAGPASPVLPVGWPIPGPAFLLDAAAEPPSVEIPVPSASYGDSGTRWVTVGGGWGFGVVDNKDNLAMMGLGAEWFIEDGLSLVGDLNGWRFDKDEGLALAGSASLMLRWHALREPTWTAYLEAGAGLLLADEDIPQDGTRFNFMPQIGGGISRDLGDGSRFVTSIRWHHISNANLSSNNPGRDSILVYAGISVPY